MNLLLLEPDDLDGDRARVRGPRLDHIRRVLGKGVGDTVKVGVKNGRIGTGLIQAMGPGEAHLAIDLTHDPPAAAPVTLALALPRPPILRRVLHVSASMGVKEIHLFHSARVEKSYWQSPALAPENLDEQVRLGLEQGVDTIWPRVQIHRRFRPFVEDVLPRLRVGARILVACTGADRPAPDRLHGPAVVVVGPEGGLVPFEVDRLAQAADLVSLGPRILRVDVAVIALLARTL